MSKAAYQKFKAGKRLTRKQAMDAQCYECNGFSTLPGHDCLGISCPLYQWSPWGKSRVLDPKNTPLQHCREEERGLFDQENRF